MCDCTCVWQLCGRTEALGHLLLLAEEGHIVGRHLGEVGEAAGRPQQLGRNVRPNDGREVGGNEGHPTLHVLEYFPLDFRQLHRHVGGGLNNV